MPILDDQAIDRIIDAAGITLCSDWNALEHDITACWIEYYILSQFASAGLARKRIERLNQLRGVTSQLIRLLEEDDGDWELIRQLWAPLTAHGPHLLPQIKLLGELIEKVTLPRSPKDAVQATKSRFHATGSALEHLTGTLLPNIFVKHFARDKAGSSRNAEGNRAPGGPYIRFASQILAEFGIEGTPETIVSALKRMKKNGAKLSE
jgi:hypothetical protein